MAGAGGEADAGGEAGVEAEEVAGGVAGVGDAGAAAGAAEAAAGADEVVAKEDAKVPYVPKEKQQLIDRCPDRLQLNGFLKTSRDDTSCGA